MTPEPDRETLERVFTRLRVPGKTLDDLLAVPALKIILTNMARIEKTRRNPVDIKKLQANDRE